VLTGLKIRTNHKVYTIMVDEENPNPLDAESPSLPSIELRVQAVPPTVDEENPHTLDAESSSLPSPPSIGSRVQAVPHTTTTTSSVAAASATSSNHSHTIVHIMIPPRRDEDLGPSRLENCRSRMRPCVKILAVAGCIVVLFFCGLFAIVAAVITFCVHYRRSDPTSLSEYVSGFYEERSRDAFQEGGRAFREGSEADGVNFNNEGFAGYATQERNGARDGGWRGSNRIIRKLLAIEKRTTPIPDASNNGINRGLTRRAIPGDESSDLEIGDAVTGGGGDRLDNTQESMNGNHPRRCPYPIRIWSGQQCFRFSKPMCNLADMEETEDAEMPSTRSINGEETSTPEGPQNNAENSVQEADATISLPESHREDSGFVAAPSYACTECSGTDSVATNRAGGDTSACACDVPQSDEEMECGICFEAYKVGDEVAWSPNRECIHHFHADCILRW